MKENTGTKNTSIKQGKPAPYPGTAPAELDAVSAFFFLINKTHIKGEIKALDKNPNGDGILDYTTADQISLGKFEVQVKTLQPKDYKNPKYQCEKDFLSHCYHTNVPVILIAVNVKDTIAYWMHIDNAVIDDAENRIRKDSLVMIFPTGNIVTKEDLAYLPQWEKIVLDDVTLRKEAQAVKASHEKQEAELAGIREKLGPPLLATSSEIRVFQIFIDAFNGLLDREFQAIKLVSYPGYWKIGVGLVSKNEEAVTFFLLPIPFGSSEALIRQLENIKPFEDLRYFHSHQALMMLSRSMDTLERSAVDQSFNLLRSEVMRVINKHLFPLPNVFLANEFVSSFMQSFRVFLGFSMEQTTCTLQELQLLITTILPVAIESGFSFIAEGITKMENSIDSERDRRAHPHYQQRLLDAREKLRVGYVPVVQIQLTSQLFPIPLLLYYITYLQSVSQTECIVVYTGGQTRFNNAKLVPSGWNKPVLFDNLRVFFENFASIYSAYIAAHFPLIQDELEMFQDCQLAIFQLMTTGYASEKAHILCYRMQHEDRSQFSTMFFLDTDTDNPIDRKRWEQNRDPSCRVNGKNYTITSVTGMPVKFIFEPSPTYALIHFELEKRMEAFLQKKARPKPGEHA